MSDEGVFLMIAAGIVGYFVFGIVGAIIGPIILFLWALNQKR